MHCFWMRIGQVGRRDGRFDGAEGVGYSHVTRLIGAMMSIDICCHQNIMSSAKTSDRKQNVIERSSKRLNVIYKQIYTGKETFQLPNKRLNYARV